MADPDDEVSQHDIRVLQDIAARHGITSGEDVFKLMVAQAAIQTIGLGRNPKTASILRCIADIVESPILSYHDEAKIGRRPM